MNYSALFTGFIGAILGACIAYCSDWLKERRKRRNEQYGAIVHAQLALIGQFNTINSLHKQYLDPLREDPKREAKLIRFDLQVAHLQVDYNAISFLLMTTHAQSVLEVHAAEQTYFSAMEALSVRNQAFDKLHANSKLERCDLQTGQCALLTDDPRHIMLLKHTTDNLYKTADAARDRLALQIKELEKAGKSIYPKKQFLKIEGPKQPVG